MRKLCIYHTTSADRSVRVLKVDLLIFHGFCFDIAGPSADDTYVVAAIHDIASVREPLGQATIVKLRGVADAQILELIVEVASIYKDRDPIHPLILARPQYRTRSA